MTVRLLLALAVVAVTARLLRRRHPALLRSWPSSGQAPDDSEVVGMPTTVTTWQRSSESNGNSWTLPPYWYVELAPTSRN